MTAVWVRRAQSVAWAMASVTSLAGSVPARTASSGMFGVTTSAMAQYSHMACSASGASSRSPLVATMTGSTTSVVGRCSANQLWTVSMIATSASIPVLTASRWTSSATAASWSRRNSTGGTWMLRTPVVFWATSEVTTVIP